MQLDLARDLFAHLDARFPQPGEAYEAERMASGSAFAGYRTCALMPTHYIGGQYLSRAHRGDPLAETPIVPVPRAEQQRAFALLDGALFAPNALRLSPDLLSHLTYSEWAGYGYVGFEGYGNLPAWAYDPPERHDVAFAEEFATLQGAAIKQLFLPAVLARLADGPAETTDRNPMRLAELFDWMHRAVFAELRGRPPREIIASRRSLQQRYLDTLIETYATPAAGAPDDARALARADLVLVAAESAQSLHARDLERTTRAHVALLNARVREALRTSR